jgi:hypothetical protein
MAMPTQFRLVLFRQQQWLDRMDLLRGGDVFTMTHLESSSQLAIVPRQCQQVLA